MGAENFTAKILAKGKIFSAWESVMVRRVYGETHSFFQFSAAEGSYGANFAGLTLQVGDPVQIYLADQLALTGFITTRSVAYDEESHQLVLAGHSPPGEASQSSAPIQPGGYAGSTFEQISRSLLAPLGINLTMSNPPPAASKPFQRFDLEYGETVAQAIGRMALTRGIFLTDDAQGNLVAGDRAGQQAATFTEGVNIKRASAKMDNQGVAGKYSAVNQSPGNDSNRPPRAISATGTQPAGPENRLRLFVPEHSAMDAQEMADHVGHIAAYEAWPVFDCSITTVGWLAPSGKLWNPSTDDATVKSPMLFPTVDDATLKLGIRAVTFAQDPQNGTTSTLDMTLPEWMSKSAFYGAQDVGGKPAETPQATPDAPK